MNPHKLRSRIKIIFALFAGTMFAGVLSANTVTTAKIMNDGDRFASGQPPALQRLFKGLYVEGEHNAVLNLDYLGLAALEQGQYTIAEKSFDAAIVRIEAIYANNPSATKAKSLFAAEKVKDFKGEPYERAMTYYYRGVLYLRSGDYQNARASFLAAEWQSTLSESEAYDSSFGLMDFLAGWASYCDGDETRATELTERAVKVQPEIFGALLPAATYLGLLELGIGPVKYGVGQYKEKLAFRPSESIPNLAPTNAPLAIAGSPVVAADINWQASTRSGRPVDAILNGKAQWKSGTETASTALTTVGYAATLQGVASGNNDLAQAGTIGMVAGLAGSLFAHAMTPAADTRAWTTLPAGIGLATGQVVGTGSAMLTFQTDSAPAVASLNVRNGKCAFSWGRTHAGIITTDAKFQSSSPDESRHEAANAQFRSMLNSTFASNEEPQTAANK